MTRKLARRSLSLSVAGAVVLGLMGLGTVAAQAAPLSESERAAGLWYADQLKFDELQAMGATGEGIKIAVIDSAINLEATELQGANITVKGSYCAFPDTGEPVPATSTDPARASHGTDVVAMLVGNGVAADGGLGTRGIAPEAEIWFYADGLPEEQGVKGTEGCLPYDGPNSEFYSDKDIHVDDSDYFLGDASGYAGWNAVNDGADIVVYSAGSADFAGWPMAQQYALREGVPIVAASLNPDGDLESVLYRIYPFTLNGTVAVSGVDADGNVLRGGGDGGSFADEAMGSPNLGFVSAASALLTPSSNDAWGGAISYGNSLATPLVGGALALGMQMYPGATANQVLQVMVRTSGGEFREEPEWLGEKTGYGAVNPTAMLEVDPRTYPDENPLFVTSLDDPRCLRGDGSVPDTWHDCAWSVGPSPEEVWPAGSEAEPGQEEPAPGGDADVSFMGPVLIGIGVVFLLGIVATAIVVPIVISRSRNRRLNVPPTGNRFGDQ